MPVRSRRSRKMRLPWSRRRLTQPIRTTSLPASAARSCPQVWVRSSVPRKSSNCVSLYLYLSNVLFQVLAQITPGHLRLFTGGEVLHRQDTGLHLVLAQNDDLARQLIRCFEGLLQPEAAVPQFDAQPCRTQFAR